MFQLSFLNAGLLFFAAATVLPLLIWLLAKKKPRRIIFSSLRFIKLSQQHEKSRTKLTNILLLVIRMLIILLLALAIARPMLALAGSKDSDKHPPTALAIIVDTSYSLDSVEDRLSRLDLAKKAINTINNNATDDDRLIVVTRDAMWNAMHSQIFAKEIPEETLRSISIAYQAMDWEDTFSFAESRLSETQMPNREIYLLSDLI
ncbi:MAG: BatA domain-containing protein, partial [Candidatus Cloacimonetes bacterium]|nr:BatA domain-containing protein [Candidatus Cloacimonadota bacterium]